MSPYIPRPTTFPLDPIRLDDGQIIEGKFMDLSQHQLLSLANQLLRADNWPHARLVFEYQYAKFHSTSPPKAA